MLDTHSLPQATRRVFLAQLGLALIAGATGRADEPRPRRILLRSSWQTVNIGDIAHTPGMLRLLATYLPEVEVVLWPSSVGDGVDRLLLSRFPRLTIIRGGDDLAAAFESCDFLLHGSRASLSAETIERWSKATGKPYGVYGITFPRRSSTSTTDFSKEALASAVQAASGARFMFFRDSKSLAFARELGVSCPVMEFGPDAAFACDLRNPRKAEAFLEANGLETGKFLCCVPRLRFTPYWRLSGGRPDPARHARNEEMKEHDHAPLREAITAVVRETEMKVLLCPEDKTQMEVGKEMILDRLPDEVRKRVVWRPDYWLTDEATSVYVRSAGLFGNEMHSPILCIGHGVPAIVCRWAEQTTKGYMWEDIGLGEWLFDLDDPEQLARVAPTVLEMARDPAAARAKAAKARQFVEQRQRETMTRLANELAKT